MGNSYNVSEASIRRKGEMDSNVSGPNHCSQNCVCCSGVRYQYIV